MRRVPPDVLEQIKARVSVVDVVRQAVPTLKKKGRDWWGCCPFHHEKTPSFHVKEQEGYYHCFGCGAHGDIFTFVKETRGGEFIDAVEELATQAGIQLKLEEKDPEEQKRRNDGFAALASAATFYQRNVTPEIRNYLYKRGLTDETIATFGLGWVPDTWRSVSDHLLNEGFSSDLIHEAGLSVKSDKGREDYDRFRGRVMFPIHNMKDQVVGFGGRVVEKSEPKYLNSSETPFFSKSHLLYNLNRAREAMKRNDQALLVEGYMDVIGLWQAGVQTAVAPMGTAVTPDQIKLLWRHHTSPIVCLDGDTAGRAAAVRLAERILPVLEPGRTLQFLWLPDGEDPDSFIQSQGLEAWNELLQTAISLEKVLWDAISENKDMQSGDDRAVIDNEMNRLVSEIKNDTVKRHYRQAWRDRLWQARRLQQKGVAGNVAGLGKQQGVPKATTGGAQRRLLRMAIERPQIIIKYTEKFSQIIFEDQRDNALRDFLFRALAENRLEKENFATYLVDSGMLPAVEELKQKMLLPPDMTESDLEASWLVLCEEVLTKQRQKAQRQAALEALAEGKLDAVEKLRQTVRKNG